MTPMSETESGRDKGGTLKANGLADRTLEHIQNALRGLRFGSVLIIVQDGVVVQIDRTEKKRVPRSPA
jgi:hypothetical protein